MTEQTGTKRARDRKETAEEKPSSGGSEPGTAETGPPARNDSGAGSAEGSRLDRVLGHPAAFIATVLVLLVLYSWTYIVNPGRVAFGDDPAFYTWRTEALLSEEPVSLMEVDGPREMLAGGYRITTPIIAGELRQVADVAPFSTTVLMMIGLRVLIPVLLGAFAYRHRRDPLVFHAVAFGSGSLLLTPPLGGYLDNVLTLFFLAASLFFLTPSRTSWPARVALGTFLVLSGLTHPTTLVFFCVVLGAIAGIHLLFRRFDIRSVIRDDGPMLVTAFVSVVLTYAIWKVGIWGEPASLSEAAVPPPAGEDFFFLRLTDWVKAMNPLLNGPLLLLGLAGLVAAGKRAAEDDLAVTTVAWMVPLAGIFGFVAGLNYPYYRFFNTTLSWVLLVGLGAYFAIRFFLTTAARGGAGMLALVGVVAIAVILGVNYRDGLAKWNDLDEAWLVGNDRANLEALNRALAEHGDGRPVVFLVDNESVTDPVRVYGFTKFSANISRYALPEGQVADGYVYLGSLENFLNDAPTEREGDEFYTALSVDTLEDTRAGLEEAGEEPIIVVAKKFNPSGANAELADQEGAQGPVVDSGPDAWTVHDGAVFDANGELARGETTGSTGPLHLLRVLVGLVLLALPGWLALRYFLPDAAFPEALGLVPALAIAMLVSVVTVVLTVTRSPLSMLFGWVCLALTVALAAYLRMRRTHTPVVTPASTA